MPKILFALSPALRDEIFSRESLRRAESFAETQYFGGPGDMDREQLLAAISDLTGLVTGWGSPRVTEEILAMAPQLRIICHSAGSVRPYVCDQVFERGVCVTNAASAIAVSVAETTIGLMIASLRHLCEYNEHLWKGGTGKFDPGPTHELTGKTVGIVGMGEVGRRVIALLKAFSCRILVFDPYKSAQEVENAGGLSASLQDVFARSDIVSLHAPDIPSNTHMISKSLLGLLRDHALFVNTARGRLVDEEALIEEVRSGRIHCALDVFEGQASEVAKTLSGVRNAILTPRIAGRSVEARRRQGDVVVEDLELFFGGKRPRNLVSKEMMEWMA